MGKHSGFTANGIVDMNGFPILNASSLTGLVQTFTETVSIEAPSRDGIMHIWGGLFALGAGAAISSGSPLNINPGRSRVGLLINTAPDDSGTLTLSGTIVDPVTGVGSAGTEDITLLTSRLGVDSSTTDAGGNTVWNFQDMIISESVFDGSVTVSTSDVNITDVDAYAISWQRRRNSSASNYQLTSVEIFAWPTATTARLFAHFYRVSKQSGDRYYDISSVVDFSQSSAPTASRPYSFRGEPGVPFTMSAGNDGMFCELQLDPTTPEWDDMTISTTFTMGLTT